MFKITFKKSHILSTQYKNELWNSLLWDAVNTKAYMS